MRGVKRGFLQYGLIVVLLYVIGGLSIASAAHAQPAMIGLAVLAFTFGLRHGFDVDHIAAIDNTVRKLLRQNQNPTGVGFFFSIGHSTVVFLMSLITIIATRWLSGRLPQFEKIGGLLGTSVSGVFLLLIGGVNVIVFIELYQLWRRLRQGGQHSEEMERLLDARGFLTRIMASAMRLVSQSWHIYPVGFLFGLGFDTASEVALLTISAEAARGSLPVFSVLGLPILFAAGMATVDAVDGVLMTSAYQWAFQAPLRKLYYNLSVTGLAVATALLIGLVEMGQVMVAASKLHGGFWSWLEQIQFGQLGYALVALFVLTWLISFGVWKLMKIGTSEQTGGEASIDS